MSSLEDQVIVGFCSLAACLLGHNWWHRLSSALEIQNFIQPAWLSAWVIDAGFLPVRSNEDQDSLSETLFAGTKDCPNFSAAEALLEELVASDLLVGVSHRVGYKCGGTGDSVVLCVSLFPKCWPLMGICGFLWETEPQGSIQIK